MTVLSCQPLAQVLKNVGDPRDRRGVRHSLFAVLSLAGSTAIDQSLLRAGMLRLLEPGWTAEPVSGSRDGEGEMPLHRVVRERAAQTLEARR